tara:strand:- start:332 stop:712 length:381 start_codon:yes stop_codon:yes gene_type:complete
MRNRRNRRFRHRSNGRGFQSRSNGSDSSRLRPSSFSNGRTRNSFINPQNAEKLVEKYNNLAKEALSSGDKILSENYFQHADHFARIFEEKNLNNKENQINNEVSKSEKVKTEEDISNSQDSTAEKK